ncbi:MAG: DinB family protein [Phycisphaerales bacterium]|nr:DinB family protein [Phycisphaerales bacterium]
MLDHARTACRFMLAYADKLTADLTDEDWNRQVAPNANPPSWIMGHLAISADYGFRLLGHKPHCPREWHDAFGPDFARKGPPVPLAVSRAEVLQRFNDGYTQLMAAAAEADPAVIAKPNGVPFFQPTPIQTIGEALVHLMTSHLGTHLGQLSYWRRIAGRPVMF